jgi:hypothetical protein
MFVTQFRCLFVAILFLMVPLQGVTADHPDEALPFIPKHDGVDFPVGWVAVEQGEGPSQTQMQVIYPAMADGEGENMAGNGPFTWVQFIGDDGEGIDQYMLLASALAKRGHIVVVHAGVSEATDFDDILSSVQIGYELMVALNESTESLPGSFGQIDLDHWGLGGHGHGAAAAYAVMPFWNERDATPNAQPPRAVFGLGADFSSWDEGDHWVELAPEGWTVDLAQPSTGLFITGTLDGVAEFNDVTSVLNGTDHLGWHAMQLLGANHYQFQASASFFESLADEDASITQEQQIERTANHIVPYLDVTLRGDHASFRTAMNRPSDVNTVSDPNAYIEENLAGSEFILTGNNTFAPANRTSFNTSETVNWRVPWTLRDGTAHDQLPSGWSVEIVCAVVGMTPFAGTLLSNGEAECLFPMADVAPGPHQFHLEIRVEGAPTTLHHDFNRTDAPLSITSPVPFIDVEQRGSIQIDASVFAFDPDGQDVLFIEAELTGGAIGNFSTSISEDRSTMIVFHTAPGEYVDGADLRLHLRADGDGVVDEAEIEAMIRIVPVDDPVVVTSTVPMQNMVEDGGSTSVVLSDYVNDPEGEVLMASISGQTQGPYGPIDFAISEGVLTITPRLNMNGASVLHLLVGDGVNLPVELDVPVYVEPMNDAMTINASYWDIELNEDDSKALNLSEMAWDLDGDVLFWTIGDSSMNVNVVRAASQILVSGAMDFYGFENTIYLNVSDGENTHVAKLNITVIAVPDAPAVTIKELNAVDERSGGLMWWVYDPDGAIPSDANVSVAGTMLENLSHSCSFDESTATNRCLTFIEYPADANGTVELRVAVIDSDLGMESVDYLTVNLSGGSDNISPVVQTDDSSDALPLVTIGVIGAIVLLAVAIIVLLSRRQGSGQVTGFTTEEAPAAVESTEAEAGGLLARARAKQ